MNRIEPNQTDRQSNTFELSFPSSAGFRGSPVYCSFMSTLVAHFTLFTLNRTTPFSPLHDVQQRTLLYHISSAVSMCTAPPEPPVLLYHRLVSIYLPALHAPPHPSVQTCASFCLRSRSFHVTPLFPFEVADPRSLHSLRSDLAASHNSRFFMPSAYTPSVQHIYKPPARTTWPGQCRLVLSSAWNLPAPLVVVCLISILLPHLATYIYPVTCIPYIVSSIDLHLKSAFCN
jgi:hypothetical protein